MENKNQTIIIGLLALIVGLLIGYNLTPRPHGFWGGMFSFGPNKYMHEEMEEHMYGYENDEVFNDGAMQHAMDEMMIGFRGKTGVAYEEAFLRGMIVHHLGAINMAEELLKETNRPELIELGNNIIETQSEEVKIMREWLDTWFNN